MDRPRLGGTAQDDHDKERGENDYLCWKSRVKDTHTGRSNGSRVIGKEMSIKERTERIYAFG
jgi:hypothetical protein